MATTESKSERLDRELSELLQGLRVLLPGVQVLFAFLLTVPFTQRFTDLTRGQTSLYVVTLVCGAIATAFLVAPSAFHRVLFRGRDKEWLIKAANGFALAGTAFLAAAIALASYLVTDFIYDAALASMVAGGLGALFFTVWYVVPIIRRATND